MGTRKSFVIDLVGAARKRDRPVCALMVERHWIRTVDCFVVPPRKDGWGQLLRRAGGPRPTLRVLVSFWESAPWGVRGLQGGDGFGLWWCFAVGLVGAEKRGTDPSSLGDSLRLRQSLGFPRFFGVG